MSLNSQDKFHLDHQPLNLDLDRADLSGKITSLVGGNASGNNGARNTSSTAQGKLAGHVDVWDVLVFAEEGEVQNDGEGSRVGGEDNELGGSAVEGFGCY
jgi:hypothetical protein